MRKVMAGIVGSMLMMAPVSAQEPTCKMCPGTYIPNGELQAYVKRAMEFGLVDQQIRAVDIGKINLDVGVVYRGKLDKPAPASRAQHQFF